MALTKKVPNMLNGTPVLRKQDSPVFTYLCSEIGETRDVNRFDIEQNDLEQASDLFNMFKGAKAKFRTDDKRCKIVDIEAFYEGSHWSVERWWTHEEKQMLGIEERVETIGIDSFRIMLDDAINSLAELEEPLSEIDQDADQELEMKDFKITELFDIVRGSGKYTKKYVQSHKGNYALFSGNTFGEFARIDSYDYDQAALSWAIDGLAGYMMVHEAPFSATNHRGVLLPKNQDINLHYVKAVLEPIFRELKKGRLGENGQNEYTSLPPYMIQNVTIQLPIDSDGNIDIGAQDILARKQQALMQVKESISDQLKMLISQKIKI